MSLQSSQKGKKTQKTTSQSVSLSAMERWCNSSSSISSLNMWKKKKWSRVVNKYSSKENHVWPTNCFLWWNDCLDRCSGWCLLRLKQGFWHCPHESKFRKYRLNQWMMRCIENWPNVRSVGNTSEHYIISHWYKACMWKEILEQPSESREADHVKPSSGFKIKH